MKETYMEENKVPIKWWQLNFIIHPLFSEHMRIGDTLIPVWISHSLLSTVTKRIEFNPKRSSCIIYCAWFSSAIHPKAWYQISLCNKVREAEKKFRKKSVRLWKRYVFGWKFPLKAQLRLSEINRWLLLVSGLRLNKTGRSSLLVIHTWNKLTYNERITKSSLCFVQWFTTTTC